MSDERDELEQDKWDLTDEERQQKAQELLAVFEDCRDYRRQFEPDAQEDFENYTLYVEKSEANKNANDEHTDEAADDEAAASNLKLPTSFRILDTLICRMYSSLVSARPWIPFKPKPTEDIRPEVLETLKAKAGKAAAVLDMDLEKNDYEAMAYEHCFNLVTAPAGWIWAGWRYEESDTIRRVPVHEMVPTINELGQPAIDPATGMQATQRVEHPEMGYVDEPAHVVSWDNNEFKCLDFLDVWPDPRGNWRIETWRFGFVRGWMTRDQIEDYLEWLEEHASGRVFDLDWDKIGQSRLYTDDSTWSREAEVDQSNEAETHIPKHKQLYEMLRYLEPDRIGLIIERKQFVYYGPNPYRHGEIPLAGGSFLPVPGRPIGLSAASRMRALQKERDTEVNQRLDNNSMLINLMWWRDPDKEELIGHLVSRPHGVIPGVYDKDFGVVPYEGPHPAGYQDPALLEREMEDALGVTSVDTGGQEEGQKTATEITIRNRGAGVRYDTRVKLISVTGLKRLAKLGDLNNQQFMDKARLVRIFDEEGIMNWAQADVGDILGEHDYEPTANNDPSVNKDLKRAQILQAAQVVFSNPALAALQKPDAWGREILRLFDIPNPDLFQMTPGEIQAQQMQQQVMMLMQQLQGQAQAEEQTTFDREKESNRSAEASRKMDQDAAGQLLQLLPQLLQLMQPQGGAQ